MKSKRILFSTKWITCTALLTALVVATGYIPAIPVLTGKIYWCDFVIYMAAYLLDPLAAAIVGGIGTTFFDLFGINGTAYNAIPSLLIHGIQGLIASAGFTVWKRFFHKSGEKTEAAGAVICSLLPAAIVIAGYFLKRLYWERVALGVALYKMPANVLQEILGIIIAVVICYATTFKRQLVRGRLLPEYALALKKPTPPTEQAVPQENTAEEETQPQDAPTGQ